jgi:hypothetical protein
MQLLTSILRTLIPSLWGSLITWAVGIAPALAPFADQLNGLGVLLVPIVTALIVGAWYAFWRWLEPHLPDWVTRAVLGSAKTPVYPAVPVTGSQTPAVNPTANGLYISGDGKLFRDGKHEA